MDGSRTLLRSMAACVGHPLWRMGSRSTHDGGGQVRLGGQEGRESRQSSCPAHTLEPPRLRPPPGDLHIGICEDGRHSPTYPINIEGQSLFGSLGLASRWDEMCPPLQNGYRLRACQAPRR